MRCPRPRKLKRWFLLKNEVEMHDAIFEMTGTGMMLVAADHTILKVNRECQRITGYFPDEIVGTKWPLYIAPESLPMMLEYAELRERDPASAPGRYEAVIVDKWGRKRNVFLTVNTMPGTSERLVSLVDVSERVEAQEALRRQNRRLALLVDLIARLGKADEASPLLEVLTEGAARLMPGGFSAVYLLERDILRLAATCPPLPAEFPEELTQVPLQDYPHIRRAVESRGPVIVEDILSVPLTPAEAAVVRLRDLRSLLYLPLSYQGKASGVLIVGSTGELYAFSPEDVGFFQALAAQASLEMEEIYLLKENRGHVRRLEQLMEQEAKARQDLASSELLFRELFQKHSAIKLLIDPFSGRILDANEAAVNFYGWSREEISSKSIFDINILPPDEIRAAVGEVLKEGSRSFEFRHRMADGSLRDVAVYNTRIHVGERVFLHSIIHDITESKRAEKEREQLQEQLLQAQKLESVGRLAAGVAHDFNNMLGIILGYGEMLLDTLHPDDPIRGDVEQMVEAARRSADLTQQLLAFSRKQTLQPEPLSLNRLVRNLERMLRRTIGEDIELRLILGEEDPMVVADPTQLEQVVINLAVNARDAMPQGGSLRIETSEVDLDEEYVRTHQGMTPGRYALLAMTDTGVGMSKEVLARIYDPFFTTKDKGKGTGLGLPTVYGIVKQSGGHIWAYSELGKGSTFKVYLPCADRAAEERRGSEPPVQEKRWGKGRQVLVVEDEEGVRNLVRALLEQMGFQVIVAANGGEALLWVEEKGLRPMLVLTDVVMPAMSGRQVAERLRRTVPDLEVLYMSGYTDNAIVHHGILDPGITFLQKPFTAEELARKLREVLE